MADLLNAIEYKDISNEINVVQNTPFTLQRKYGYKYGNYIHVEISGAFTASAAANIPIIYLPISYAKRDLATNPYIGGGWLLTDSNKITTTYTGIASGSKESYGFAIKWAVTAYYVNDRLNLMLSYICE